MYTFITNSNRKQITTYPTKDTDYFPVVFNVGLLLHKMRQQSYFFSPSVNNPNLDIFIHFLSLPPIFFSCRTRYTGKEMTRERKQMLIAMKGHPGTGKSTLAQSLASALRIPLLDKDDVRDSTYPLQSSLLPFAPTTASCNLLNDLSYDVIYRIASTQLRLGLSVVVDSPLSRKAHLERLVQLASSAGARVLVVECQPTDEAEWRRRLEHRGASAAADGAGWHKPATWRDLERLLEGYAGCTEYDFGEVPRLVVDTTASVEVGELVSSVVEFIDSHMET